MPAKLRCKSAVGNNQTKRKKPHQVKVPFLKFVIALWKGVLEKKKKIVWIHGILISIEITLQMSHTVQVNHCGQQKMIFWRARHYMEIRQFRKEGMPAI